MEAKAALESLIDRLEAYSLFFGFLVVIGVGGEVIFGVRLWWNQRKLRDLLTQEENIRTAEIARALERAAEANQKAEEEKLARVKLEAQIAPRRMSRDQRAAAIAAMKKFGGQRIAFTWFGNDLETRLIGDQVLETIQASGISTAEAHMGYSNTIPVGIIVEGPPNDQLAAGIARALRVEGGLGKGVVLKDGTSGQVAVMVGLKPID